MFKISDQDLNIEQLKSQIENEKAGALVTFEGWVRNHNEGHSVDSLEYETYDLLAEAEAQVILKEAREKFDFFEALCVHRKGHLQIGDIAVWLGVTSAHRANAFKACQYIIDEIKHRLPIWKKEHYTNKKAEWVNCQGCYKHDHDHSHDHKHESTTNHNTCSKNISEQAYYAQQTKLAQVGLSGQEKLKNSSVLVIGAGGLGCPALQYLTTAGVGRIGICDFDRVSASNLNRQILYTPQDVDKLKVEVAQNKLQQLNPFIDIQSIDKKLNPENALDVIGHFDLVLDCTDNFQATYLIHDTCFLKKIPLVQASIYQYEGQIQSYLFNETEKGCMRCLSPEQPDDSCTGNCDQAGVLGVVPGLLGTQQAAEALKIILGLGSAISQKICLVNLLNNEQTLISTSPNNDCPLCGVNQSINPINSQTYKVDEDFSWEIDVPFKDSKAQLTWVDIRNLSERNVECSFEAQLTHIPLHDTEGLTSLPREKDYLIVCQTGRRSKNLTKNLRQQGFNNFYSLKGGLSQIKPNLSHL